MIDHQDKNNPPQAGMQKFYDFLAFHTPIRIFHKFQEENLKHRQDQDARDKEAGYSSGLFNSASGHRRDEQEYDGQA